LILLPQSLLLQKPLSCRALGIEPVEKTAALKVVCVGTVLKLLVAGKWTLWASEWSIIKMVRASKVISRRSAPKAPVRSSAELIGAITKSSAGRKHV
jgi:hypothetical protein